VTVKKWKILIVDDEDAFLGALKEWLAPLGSVTAVVDGTDAAILLEKEPYDLVITDLHMPEMNGMTLIETIRARFKRLPIIVCTGYPSAAGQLRAQEAGVTHYFEKPVKLELIFNAAKELLCDIAEKYN
jgi:two-component system response regulator FlrC